MVKEPEYRFLHYLFEKTGKWPTDPEIQEMDPYLKLFLFESWIHKLELDIDKQRRHGILIGSFTNPKAAEKMLKNENGADIEISDEDYDDSINLVREGYSSRGINIPGANNSNSRRRRKKNRQVIG